MFGSTPRPPDLFCNLSGVYRAFRPSRPGTRGAALATAYGLVQQQAATLSFQDVFLLTAVLVVPAFLLAVLLPGHRIRRG